MDEANSKAVRSGAVLKAESKGNSVEICLRTAVILIAVCMFIPSLNPARMSGLISGNTSLFTTGISYSGFAEVFSRALKKGWILKSTLVMTYTGAIIACIGACIAVAGCAMTLGELKLKRLGGKFCIFGSIGGIAGVLTMVLQYSDYSNSLNAEKIDAVFPKGSILFVIGFLVCSLLATVYIKGLPKENPYDKYEMASKYQLFLMMTPFIALLFLFNYLPLWGWRYSFFDYTPGSELTKENFVGLKWFKYLFENSATSSDIIRVLKNTLAMSGLGLLTSWLPMAFAIFLSEIKNDRFRRIVQTITTIPNFISWVLVYTFAFALFSSEGFINTFLIKSELAENSVDFLMGEKHIWLKMLGWGLWKSLGWNSIIYIASISGIDQGLYEAATIDGAGRFAKIWNITIPSLMPTFFVLLLLSIAGILSNGMDQYLVFKNATNKNAIEVLDLYVYNLGLGGSGSGGPSQIPLSTVVSMIKSIVSVVLLFSANKASKAIRGESIV